MTSRFQPGDVVQLKSGGTLMTVSKVMDAGAYCTWFDETGAMQGRVLPEATLQFPPSEEPDTEPTP